MDIERLVTHLSVPVPEDVQVDGDVMQAAVAAILRPSPARSGYDLLFIRRAEHDRDPWSGHMAFPGGRVDPEDTGPQAAAVREVMEEVGIDLMAHGRLLGRLAQVASPPLRSRVVVTPYVWVLSRDVPTKLDPREVAGVHWFSLDRWIDGEGRGTFDYRFRGRQIPLPRVDLDGQRVWGMTLKVVDDLLTCVRRAT